MEPILIAKENVNIVLQVIGQEVSDLVDTFTVGSCTYSDVVQGLYNETRQLWVLPTDGMLIQGWLITKIQQLPHGKRLIFDLFGGHDVDLLLAHLDTVEAWAEQYGAVETFGYVRPGLRKKLKKHGFSHVCDIVIRPLKRQVH